MNDAVEMCLNEISQKMAAFREARQLVNFTIMFNNRLTSS